ncbi:hypothetical protein C8N24_0925 [Solirubrobacter pauli]|uniref:Lipoprotein n=1 Tax=Solirubrobacter pauli TaxID=166793 RepID=A0A660L7R5_9ACTN|nr:hypothetical protein [Solirubrobacter pauli]RKQ91108.1 hypothetical protein C8N24_0925 [Solirubrobacter pauli]
MRRLLLVVLALLTLAACGGSEPKPAADAGTSTAPTAEPTATGDLNTCAGLVQDEGRSCYSRELAAIVNGAGDPLAAVEGITQAAYADQSGFLLANCHGIMHTVAREYALRTGLKLENLMDSLPRTNDPGCSAGYAHGLVTAVAPEIEKQGPTVANRLCKNSETRYQRYSCTHGFGHAFMRLSNENIAPALQMCQQLGSAAAADCSQGIYHDYWFAVNGIDSTAKPKDVVTDPRALCGAQPEEFVRVCWYRSFVETAKGTRMESGAQIDEACSGLDSLQRQACVTGASVIGPPDPVNQLAVCAGLEADSDVVACIRGTKVQNLMNYPPEMSVDLIKACNTTFRGSLAIACDRWLGKTLGVVSDGEFRTTGCPKLQTAAARKACVAGVKSMEGPLVTFS